MFSSFSCVGRETSRIPEKIRGERRKTKTKRDRDRVGEEGAKEKQQVR